MGTFRTIDDVWGYLDTVPMFSKMGSKASNFALENISSFCDRIGNPQENFRSIHVAGTNGKGTTCYLLESIYKNAGYKTGMFTSPHLLRYNERVRLSGTEISNDLILDFFKEVESTLKEIPLTYFEISTALSFWAFSREAVEIAIIETGLGGRLDSTNIILPELSIITSIGKDHEQILGESLNEIAFEKAGIIKEKKPIILGNLDLSSEKIISRYAESKKAKVILSSRLKPSFEKGVVQFEGIKNGINTSFLEPINKWNVVLSYLAVNELKSIFTIEESTIGDSIESFKGVPARFEKLIPNEEWYFSGSHNEQAIDAMLDGVSRIPKQRKIAVLSMMKDKINERTLAKFKDFSKVYYYQQSGDRAASIDEIMVFIEVEEIHEINAKKILNELHTELVIFAGSFYFYPTIKRWLTNKTEYS